MPDKFRNKFRIESARLKHWDYGWNAAYFVTICTQNRECFFGDVVNGKDALPCVSLSPIGEIAHNCWLAIPSHFPFVKLGEHIVMPNHVHGIVVIDKPDDGRDVETQNFASLPVTESVTESPTKNKFGPQSKNLASIIRGFKIGVTQAARLINPDFAWQPRYHDHIIRDDASFYRIAAYIKNNPRNWSSDQFR
ncbi:MAG: hypothetical protein H6555_09255 [Lewinellaceae bacterium]|nr:hypothetical protein [Lewinellaceae bacterium]